MIYHPPLDSLAGNNQTPFTSGTRMYSALAFILTALEMGAAIAGFALQNQLIFYNVLVYGSPFYLLQHAIGPSSFLHDSNYIYWVFIGFHLIKYFMIFEAQRREDRNIVRTFALLFEAIYLGLSTYYLL